MSDPICAECGKPIKPHDCLQRNSRDERIAALEAENAKLRELDVVARAACIAMMEERDNYKESCSEFDRELAGVVSGLGCSVEFMDPPDGGSVTLGEQVGRMRDALTTARRECEEAEAAIRWLTSPEDGGSYPFALHGFWKDGTKVYMSPDNVHADACRRAHERRPK